MSSINPYITSFESEKEKSEKMDKERNELMSYLNQKPCVMFRKRIDKEINDIKIMKDIIAVTHDSNGISTPFELIFNSGRKYTIRIPEDYPFVAPHILVGGIKMNIDLWTPVMTIEKTIYLMEENFNEQKEEQKRNNKRKGDN